MLALAHEMIARSQLLDNLMMHSLLCLSLQLSMKLLVLLPRKV